MTSISIAYQNTRGLRTKSSEFLRNTISTDHDIVCITETWLNQEHFNNDYFPNTYNIYRSDRHDPHFQRLRGGGALIAVNKSLPCVRRVDLEGVDECVFVEIKISTKRSLILGTAYFQPANNDLRFEMFCAAWLTLIRML